MYTYFLVIVFQKKCVGGGGGLFWTSTPGYSCLWLISISPSPAEATLFTANAHTAGHLFPVFILWVILFSSFPPHLLQFTFLPSRHSGQYRSEASAARQQPLITAADFSWKGETTKLVHVQIWKDATSEFCFGFYYKIHTSKAFSLPRSCTCALTFWPPHTSEL